MNRRVPFFVAVVGALLIGSATTGTTHASWTDQAPLPVTQVSSGSMSFSASTPAGVSVKRTAGETATSTITVADTSSGKNLKQRITAAVASTPAGVTASVATSCGGSGSAVDTTPGSGNQTFCVKVTSSTTAVSGTVVVTLGGTQRPTGWSTPGVTRSVAVTVSSAIPEAPSLSCSTGRWYSGSVDFSWSEISGATGYTLSYATTDHDWRYDELWSGSRTEISISGFSDPSTYYFRVTATNSAGTSQDSNTVKVVRKGFNFWCGAA